MMTKETQDHRKKTKPEYRDIVHPRQFRQFLDGGGTLTNRAEIAEQFDYDWHARKLHFDAHFQGHVLMQATAYQSTRDHQWAAQNDALFAANGAAVEISVSGLAQANKDRPLEPYLVLVQQVLDAVAHLPHRRLRALDKQTWRGITNLLSRVDIFDATTLHLPPKLADWAPGSGNGRAALKLQLKIDGKSGVFKRILLTPAPGNDSPYFNALLGDLDAQTGSIFVFDGGYWRKDTYRDIVASGNHFVTKRAGKLKPHIVEERPLPDEPPTSGYTIRQDAIVHLGDEQPLYRMLRVEMTNGKTATLISSLLDSPADHICLLYRYRWTIEIVFRWLRQTLQLDHMMSHHPTGIVRQILVALIVWGLLVIANQDTGSLSPKQLWRRLQADLHQAILEFGFALGQAHATLP
jgi:hypothetical protein